MVMRVRPDWDNVLQKPTLEFFCPRCDKKHEIVLSSAEGWNRDKENPTVYPKAKSDNCAYTIKDGWIIYEGLEDSPYRLPILP